MLIIKNILKATQGILVQGKDSLAITSVCINSRVINKGALFIAIKGERFDGHDFIQEAVKKGATAILASKRVSCCKDIAIIRVKDTTKALGEVASWHRNQFKIPVIAVTGSSGKTTTKEMIASVLASRFKVLKNVKTENNQFGVPMTILRLNKSYQIAVLEFGSNRPGEILWLCKIARPTMAVYTNVGESHLAYLKSKAGVFREKYQLVKQMSHNGHVIINSDDTYLKNILKKKISQRIITYAIGHKADHQASHVVLKNNRQIQFKLQGRVFSLKTPVQHNVYNALAAISCGLLCKVSYSSMTRALAGFKFCEGRLEIQKVGRLWLINDSYNSNPVSFKSAITTLDSLKTRGRKILVCADMLELGRQAKTLHRSMGRIVAKSTVDFVITIGSYAKYIMIGLKKSNRNIKTLHCVSLNRVHQHLKGYCQPGDVLLVKGSRRMRLERTVDYLRNQSAII